MAISSQNRTRFEAIGLPGIRRELVVGNVQYLHGEEQRRQASEWVAEEEARVKEEITRARRVEATKFISALFVSIIAAVAAMIAAWPVIKDWLR